MSAGHTSHYVEKTSTIFRKQNAGLAAAELSKGRARITILDLDVAIIDWFKAQVEEAGGGNYQSLINAALREHIGRLDEPLEKTLIRVLREELRKASLTIGSSDRGAAASVSQRVGR